ncbi:MAG: type II toxin-antitoxin system PemK/MazF family toxin [Bellilinea sp.]
MGMVKRFDVYLVNLDPTVGHETKKSRPCLVISPDELNRNISTVIVAPMTTKGRNYPSRVSCTFSDKKGQILLEQMRAVDKTRLIKRLGKVGSFVQAQVFSVLSELFSE